MKKSSARVTKASKKKRSSKVKTKKSPKEKRQEKSDKNVAALGIQVLDKTEYDEDFHPESFVQHCREGDTPTYICGVWGISRRTLDRWTKLYPEMTEAYAIGKTAYEAFWQHRLKGSIIDVKSHFKAFNFIWMSKNTMGWSDQGGNEFPGSAKEEFTFQDGHTGKLFDSKGKEIKKDQ